MQTFSRSSMLVFAAALGLWPINANADSPDKNECVILLHGLGRSKYSLRRLESELLRNGYAVYNQGYPSTSAAIQQLAERHVGAALQECQRRGAQKIHFVTHSLGGILLRQYFAANQEQLGGRVVMLAPPNQGSQVVDRLRNYRLFQIALGPAALQLGTQVVDLPKTIPPTKLEIGIIAGRKSSDPWFSAWLPGEDDGKVTVESTRLAGMKDFLVVDAGHTAIMNDPKAMANVLYFLKFGRFLYSN